MLDSRGQKYIPARLTRTLVLSNRHYYYRGKNIGYVCEDQRMLIRRLGGLRGTNRFRVEYVPTRNTLPPTSGRGWQRVKKGNHDWTDVGHRQIEFCTEVWKNLFGITRMGWIRLVPIKELRA